ncbi:hypothetical protein Tco_1361213 [Tanacetum coccineum]
MTKNIQRVASDTNITNTMLRFVIGILRHHKLYKPVSLTATVHVIHLHQFWTTITHNSNTHTFTFQLDTQTFTLNAGLLRNILQMPQPDSRKYTSWDTARLPILQILWEIVHSTNLDFASLIWDEFEWQAVDRITKLSKMSKLMYTHFTKLIIDHFLSCNKSIPRRSDFDMHNEGQDVPLTKLTNTVKAKKVESEKEKAVEEPEEQHESLVRSGRGKANNIVEEQTAVELAKSLSIEEQLHQQRSLLDIRKGSKASRLESMKQMKQEIAGEGSSATHNKYYEFENILATDKDELKGDDDDAGYGVFMCNKSTEPLKSTYLSPTGTCSSLDYIQIMLNETPANNLTDFMSHPVYTDAQTTSAIIYLDGNHELTSYISGASKVPVGTHVDVQATNILLQEMFPEETAHHNSSPPAITTSYPITKTQDVSLQAKAKKLMQK